MMAGGGPTRILIIDDSETDRYTYRRYLEQVSSRYEIYEAEDGETGLRLAEQVHPHCVLLDLRLSNQSGYEVLRDLVNEDGSPKIPVIMLSVLTWQALQKGAASLGAYGFLVKGNTDGRMLDQAIHDAIERHQHVGTKPAA